jgi:hypothetical protein
MSLLRAWRVELDGYLPHWLNIRAHPRRVFASLAEYPRSPLTGIYLVGRISTLGEMASGWIQVEPGSPSVGESQHG